jgi:hypothetical protein
MSLPPGNASSLPPSAPTTPVSCIASPARKTTTPAAAAPTSPRSASAPRRPPLVLPSRTPRQSCPPSSPSRHSSPCPCSDEKTGAIDRRGNAWTSPSPSSATARFASSLADGQQITPSALPTYATPPPSACAPLRLQLTENMETEERMFRAASSTHQRPLHRRIDDCGRTTPRPRTVPYFGTDFLRPQRLPPTARRSPHTPRARPRRRPRPARRQRAARHQEPRAHPRARRIPRLHAPRRPERRLRRGPPPPRRGRLPRRQGPAPAPDPLQQLRPAPRGLRGRPRNVAPRARRASRARQPGVQARRAGPPHRRVRPHPLLWTADTATAHVPRRLHLRQRQQLHPLGQRGVRPPDRRRPLHCRSRRPLRRARAGRGAAASRGAIIPLYHTQLLPRAPIRPRLVRQPHGPPPPQAALVEP